MKAPTISEAKALEYIEHYGREQALVRARNLMARSNSKQAYWRKVIGHIESLSESDVPRLSVLFPLGRSQR